MIKYSEKCSGCGACRMICPQEAIELIKDEWEFEYPKIDVKKCIGCGTCVSMCPVEAISFDENGRAKINKDICIKCGTCEAVCPVGAIKIER